MEKKWKKIMGGGNFFKWAEQGQELEGIYMGQHDGKFGPNGTINTSEGEKIFPIHTALVSLLDDIQEGKYIKIIYLGKQTNKNTGREYKAFDVYAEDIFDGSVEEVDA